MKKNFTNLVNTMQSGFSLMEMMVVLLIVAVIMAASAPMISKKVASGVDDGLPLYSMGSGNIGFNLGSGQEHTFAIGTNTIPDTKPRLLIKSKSPYPHITLQNNNSTPDNMHIMFGENKSLRITNSTVAADTGANAIAIGSPNDKGAPCEAQSDQSIAIGRYAYVDKNSTASIAIGETSYVSGANGIAIGSRYEYAEEGKRNCTAAKDSIAIGKQARAVGQNSTAIGSNAKAENQYAVAIGQGASADNYAVAIGTAHAKPSAISIGGSSHADENYSIAIGASSNATKQNSVAIGYVARAEHENSVAIGYGARTTGKNQIVLGNGDSVYIPGNLFVGGNVHLGINNNSHVFARLNDNGYTNHTATNNYTLLYGNWHIGDNPYGEMRYRDQDAPSLSSDRRLKNVGEVYKGGLAELKKLEFYNYTFKKDKNKTPRVGVMAQDLQKVFPDAVIKGEDGFLRIRLEDMFYAVINAVKELDSRLTALAEQVKSTIDLTTALQKKVTAQEKQIAELEKQNAEFKKQNADFEKRLAKLEKSK